MRMSEPAIYNMTDEEFDEFQDRLYDMARTFYASNDLARYLPIPPPAKPQYVTRDNDGDHPNSRPGDCPNFRPGDCPNFRPSENGTVPFGVDDENAPIPVDAQNPLRLPRPPNNCPRVSQHRFANRGVIPSKSRCRIIMISTGLGQEKPQPSMAKLVNALQNPPSPNTPDHTNCPALTRCERFDGKSQTCRFEVK